MKILKTLLTLLLCAAVTGCAAAEALDKSGLVGTWSPEYMSVAMYCTINADSTFDVQVYDDLPIGIESFSGTWSFDGFSDVTFTYGDQSMTFFWDGATLSSALGGLPIVLTRDWDPDEAAADTPSEEAGSADAPAYYGTDDATEEPEATEAPEETEVPETTAAPEDSGAADAEPDDYGGYDGSDDNP